jgi:asparagine synthase (glutamine-hydrolysing)
MGAGQRFCPTQNAPEEYGLETLLETLRQKLQGAVQRHPAPAILLSGGLDTSIIAMLAGPGIEGITVQLGQWGEDQVHAQRVAQLLGIRLHTKRATLQEALEALPEVIRLRRSFDPALPNDLAIYLGLQAAKELGLPAVLTGDGADELFAGYSYMAELDLDRYLPELAARMQFGSTELAGQLGLEVKQPFLDPELVQFALSIPPELKIREENGKLYGKWVLRKAFEAFLPPELIWQSKRPIEVGSGFSQLRSLAAELAPATLEAVGAGGRRISFLCPDHPYYYWLYRQVVGEVPPPAPGEEPCPGCGAGLSPSAFHCRICGWCRKWE